MTETDAARLGTAKAIRDSGKALLVEIEGEQFWVPKSVIHEDSEVWEGDSEEGELIVKEWWAKANGHA